MASDRLLSQEEIDNVFRNVKGAQSKDAPAQRAQVYDFRRPDRIAKDQLRAIHLLHDNFARSLASSLSAYLRAYVIVNLISVEQLSFLEFSQCLPAPTCIVSLGMKPFDGNSILEMNPQMVFPILEMLLGGTGKTPLKENREITEIERSILTGVFRIILHDLGEAWSPISHINFSIEAFETEPQLLQILAPNEAVVAIGIEIRIGEVSGMMNLGIPSIIVKMLRQKFDQQWSVRKSESTEEEQERMWRLLQPARLRFDARMIGPTLTVEQMLELKEGDILDLDYPVRQPLDLLVNGTRKYLGRVGTNGRRRVFQIETVLMGE
ncbi:MAG: flagellar motor switch protein FliM [Bryobacteraceae bacterium]